MELYCIYTVHIPRLCAAFEQNKVKVLSPCVMYVEFTHCQQYYQKQFKQKPLALVALTVFLYLISFSGHFQAVRALMVVAIVLSVTAAFISLFSLKCVKTRSMEHTTKAKMTLCAGVMFFIAGKHLFHCFDL